MPEGVPRADVRVKGTINSLLHGAKEAYEKKHDDKRTRFAYAPEGGSAKYSGMARHRSRGYKIVTNQEAGTDDIYGAPDEPVRVGDTVLVAADKKRVEAREAELGLLAEKDANRSIEVYKESVERAGTVGRSKPKAHGYVKKTTVEYPRLPQREEE